MFTKPNLFNFRMGTKIGAEMKMGTGGLSKKTLRSIYI